MNVSQMTQKLLRYPIDHLSTLHGFNLRGDAKVSLLNFLGGFYLSICSGHSLKEWASQLSHFLAPGISVSKAGLQKRLGTRQLDCVKRFLEEQIRTRVRPLQLQSQADGWFKHFGQVLIEDSVCVSLNRQLYETFQGSHSRSDDSNQSATARIQLCLNLKTLVYTHFALMGYRDNDQKYSPKIVSRLKKGDLVIRDLGYTVLRVLDQIQQKGAFFLSRYKSRTNLYDAQTKDQIDLTALLSQADKNGHQAVDINVLVGAKVRLKARMVAIKCPPEIANSRIRKAKKNRNKKANHSPAYYELLKWNIFLTNVKPDIWKPEQILTIYGFRWHIEMVFKVWKSKFGLQDIMKKSQIVKPIHAQIFFYLFLSFLLLFYARYFHYFFEKLIQQKQKVLSLFGFADFLKKNLLQILKQEAQQQLNVFLDELAQFYCCEKRAKRHSQLQILFLQPT